MKSYIYRAVSDVDLGWRGMVLAGFLVAVGTFLGTFMNGLAPPGTVPKGQNTSCPFVIPLGEESEATPTLVINPTVGHPKIEVNGPADISQGQPILNPPLPNGE